MNRRQFLTRALCAVPAVAIAPAFAAELAEILAPKRTIFLPPAGGWAQYVRRAFISKLIVQIYTPSPLMKALLSQPRLPDAHVAGVPVFFDDSLGSKWELQRV